MRMSWVSIGVLALVANISFAGERVSKQVDLSGVDELYFSGDVNVELSQGARNQATVEFNEDDQEKVEVIVKGNKFVIKRNSNFWDFWRNSDSVVVSVKAELENITLIESSGASKVVAEQITAQGLQVKASGASELHFDNLGANTLKLGLSGASSVTAGDINAQQLKADISGASRVELTGSGEVNTLKVDASGASQFRAKDIVVSEASVHGSGASNFTVNVTDQLNANLSGATNLQYGGSPRTDVHTSGASNISAL